MRFSEVIGQRELKRHLVRGVDAGRVSHAQLFTGRRRSGARSRWQWLMCSTSAAEPPRR